VSMDGKSILQIGLGVALGLLIAGLVSRVL
jgi:uncharacterized membrane protein YdfJ with MMPL/SSD domain